MKAGDAFDKRLNDAKDKAGEAMKIAKELKKTRTFSNTCRCASQSIARGVAKDTVYRRSKQRPPGYSCPVEYMDPVFERRNQENTLKLARDLKGDQEFKESRESWQQDSFTTEKRLKILQKAVNAYAVAFDIKRFAPEPGKYKAPRVVPMDKSLPFPDKRTTLANTTTKTKSSR